MTNVREGVIELLEAFQSVSHRNLIVFCDNSSQYNSLIAEQTLYTELNHMLTCYFTGQAPPLYRDSRIGEILEYELEKKLIVYGLLFWGWDVFKLELERIGIDLKEQGISAPKDALKLILANEALNSFLQSKAYHIEFSPQKAYRRSNEYLKLSKNGFYDFEDHGLTDVKAIVENKKNRQIGESVISELHSFEMFCIAIFYKHRSHKKIKKRIEAYFNHSKDGITLLNKLTNPNIRQKGYSIVNGEKHRRS